LVKGSQVALEQSAGGGERVGVGDHDAALAPQGAPGRGREAGRGGGHEPLEVATACEVVAVTLGVLAARAAVVDVVDVVAALVFVLAVLAVLAVLVGVVAAAVVVELVVELVVVGVGVVAAVVVELATVLAAAAESWACAAVVAIPTTPATPSAPTAAVAMRVRRRPRSRASALMSAPRLRASVPDRLRRRWPRLLSRG
jgi:hypothetical protein